MQPVIAAILVFFGLSSGLLFNDFTALFPLLNLSVGLILSLFFFVSKVKSGSFGNVFARGFAGKMLSLFAALILLIVLNILIFRHNQVIDLTENEIFSLSTESLEISKRVAHPLKFFIMDDFNNATRAEVRQLFTLYSQANPQISFEIIDPRTARQVRDYINPAEKVIYAEYQSDKKAVGHFAQASEAKISEAIFKITSTKARVTCYAVGHGEPDPDSAADDGLRLFTEFLKSQNIALVGLLLDSVTAMPKECESLILMPVKTKYKVKEQDLVKDYLRRGGQVLALHDPETAEDFNWLGQDYGIEILKAVILDKQQELQGAAEIGWQIFIKDFANHPVNKNLKAAQTPLVFLLGSPLKLSTPAEGLIFSSSTAWGESDLAKLFNAAPQASFEKKLDYAGPLPVAAVTEKIFEQPQYYGRKSRLIVVGENKWLNNANFEIYFNRDFLSGILAAFGEANLAELNFPAKLIRPTRLQPISGDLLQKLLFAAFAIPEFLLLLLLFLIHRRRQS